MEKNDKGLEQGKKTTTPNALVDTDLEIVDANASFFNFLGTVGKGDRTPGKITDVIEFDNLVGFQQSLQQVIQGSSLKSISSGKIKKGDELTPVVIFISHVDPSHQNWRQGLVNLSYQPAPLNSTSLDLSQDKNISPPLSSPFLDAQSEDSVDSDVQKQQSLQDELDIKMRELSSNLILLSQKNILIKSVVQKIEKIQSKSEGEVSRDLLRLIRFINSQDIFDENWEKLKIHFTEMNPDFFKKIKQQAEGITEKDLRHCAYLKIGLSVKETSQLLGVLPKSIEMARYRIKKKFKLESEEKLTDFIRNI